MEIKNIEECKKYVKERLEDFRPIFARAAIGDFSQDLSDIKEDDEFSEFYVGIQTMIDVIRDKISSLENEIKERHETEQRLISRNREQAETQKAMLNILEDLEKAKTNIDQDEAKYEALLGSIGDGILATDNGGKVIFINSTAEKLLGWSAQELVGNKFTDLVRAEDKKGNTILLKDRVISQAVGGKSVSLSDNYYYVKRDKTRLPVAVNASPVLLGKRVMGAVAVFRDITKDLELDRAKSEFISIASHQLRTPVTALKWLTEISESSFEKFTSKERDYFKDLSSSIERLSKLVEDLLNVSRIELGTIKEERIKINLVDFVGDFVKDMKPYAEAKKHTLALDNKTKDVFVEIDSKMLYNVLQNLVSNGIDYSPPDSIVTIVVDSDQENVKVSISNSGLSIPKDEQAKLFQKFYRGESTRKMKAEGTGLGLYIVKSNIDSAGGKVGLESVKGGKTTFWFNLPLKK